MTKPNMADIVHEDEHIIVVNKKAGVVVFPPKGDSPAICHYLKSKIIDVNKFESPDQAGIVHRLDKDTTGLLLCAKTPQSEIFLKEQFKKHNVKKIYHALVRGPLYQAKGMLDFPLVRAKHPFKRMVRKDGKKTLTEYQVLKRNEKMTLIEVKLHTGRTHQIRVHFSHIRHPILGDKLYNQYLEHRHLYLQAKQLGFVHPNTNEWMEFKVDYPDYFKTLIKTFTN